MFKTTVFILFFLNLLAFRCNSQKNSADRENVNDVPKLIPDSLDVFRPKVADSLKYLLPLLDSVLYYDQKYRVNNNAKIFLDNKKKVEHIDSSNLVIVSKVIDKYGVLDLTDIGMNGYLAIAMTIIHAPIEVQEKYLPLFRKGIADKKKIMPSHYAMLEDKIAVKRKRLQVFGTQVMISATKKNPDVWPLISPDSIDIRRKSIGMTETMEIYLKRFNIKWDIKKYKKQLPALKEKYGIKD